MVWSHLQRVSSNRGPVPAFATNLDIDEKQAMSRPQMHGAIEWAIATFALHLGLYLYYLGLAV